MLEIGFSYDLLFAALAILIFGIFFAIRDLSFGSALLISTAKVALPLFFFAWFDSGQYRYFDDVEYVAKSWMLRDRGFTVWNTLIGTAPSPLSYAIGGEHVLYYWWNLLAFELFGLHYWSAVFLNVGITFVGAHFLGKVWLSLGLPSEHKKYIVGFFLLHWDVLMWSSLINLKDSIVAALTIISFWSAIELLERKKLRQGLILIFCLFLLTKIRHYVPPVFVGCLILTFAWRTRGPLAIVGGIFSLGILFFLKPWESKELGLFNFSNLPFKCIRFILMPYFWGIESSLHYMEIPQFFHWLLFPVALFGAYRLFKEFPASRFLFLYFSAMVLFYASVPKLQGPRQRFQLVGIFALCQLYGASLLLVGRRASTAPLSVAQG